MKMHSLIFSIVITLLGSSLTRANFVIEISPRDQTVFQNSQLTFDIIFSTSQANLMLSGIDLGVLAGTGSGSEGVFIAEKSFFGNEPWDLDKGDAFLAFSLGASPFDTGASNTIHRLGELTLDLSGVAPGTYSLQIYDQLVLGLVGSSLVEISSTTLGGSYTISAIPEPASMVLMATGLLMVSQVRRLRTGNSNVVPRSAS